MCGIAGFSGKGNREVLEKMTRTLSYRGPDGEGYYFDEKLGIGLGHRRLAIIDVGGGAQPIFNEDQSVAVIFNGEIYNFLELRKDLESRHKFLTYSDTEVIAHLYEEDGERIFEKINGMFAIAMYDARRQKLVLARDRLGKKPLYWGIFNNTLIFGSEPKAISAHPLFKKKIDLESLNQYFALDYVPTPRSIWKGVFKLEPASYLVWQNGKIRKTAFWKPNFETKNLSFEESVKELDSRVNESVRRRLVSDVPLGIFLSGGIDSSAIAYYAQKNSSAPIKTFSIAFNEESFDESVYAKKVSAFLRTDHYEERFSAKDLLAIMPKVSQLSDEPLADPSILPAYLLSRFARQEVTVALGGDGGDELFAGYPTFQAEKIANFLEILPKFLWKPMLKKIAGVIPVNDSNFSLDFKLLKFIDGFEVPKAYRHQRWLGSFGRQERSELFAKEAWDYLEDKNEYESADRYIEEAKNSEPGNALLYSYLRTYLMDGVLVRVDRASMFNSLEVRAPFLDYRLVDFVNSLQ